MSLSNLKNYEIEKDDSQNILDANGEGLKRINDSYYSLKVKPKNKLVPRSEPVSLKLNKHVCS